MAGIKKDKQKEIERKISGYLEDPKAPKRSWAELVKMAEKDHIPPATLSRHLKSTAFARNIDPEHRPPRVYYSLNRPLMSPSVRFNLPRLPPRSTIEAWKKFLQTYAKKTRNLHLVRRDEENPMLFVSLSGMMIEILLFHVWASAFPEERLDDAVEYLRGQMTEMMERYLQYYAKPFVHYAMLTRKELIEAAEAFISHTQATVIAHGISQDKFAETNRPLLQFKPTIR